VVCSVRFGKLLPDSGKHLLRIPHGGRCSRWITYPILGKLLPRFGG